MEKIKEKWNVVQDNIGLIHVIADKIISNNPELQRRRDYWYEEFVSEGKFGLIKAVDTYIDSKSQFSTYAGVCIRNEINMYLEKEFTKKKGYSRYVTKSLDTDSKFRDEENSNSNNLYSILVNQFDVIDVNNLEEKEFILKYINIILNYLPRKEICSIFYYLSGIKQKDIAKKLNISQPHTSRIIKEGIKHSREQLLNTEKFNSEPFCMKETSNGYILTVSTDDYFARAVQIINSFVTNSTISCQKIKRGMSITTQALDEDYFFILAEILNN